MKLEGVCTVSVRGLLLQILWQIDDHDCIERAFLDSRYEDRSQADGR